MATAGRLNIRMQTLGGSIWWTDVQTHAGYRLQQSFWNEAHYRILDPVNVRFWWDKCTLERARRAFKEISRDVEPPRTITGQLAAEPAALAEQAVTRAADRAGEDALITACLVCAVLPVALGLAVNAGLILLLVRAML